jgi:hypothetical protein
MCEIFQKQRTFGKSNYPFNLARSEALNYDRSRFSGTFSALDLRIVAVLVLPWNERYTDEHVDYIAAAIHDGVQTLAKRRRKANVKNSSKGSALSTRGNGRAGRVDPAAC